VVVRVLSSKEDCEQVVAGGAEREDVGQSSIGLTGDGADQIHGTSHAQWMC
jgi:hypothetical protein